MGQASSRGSASPPDRPRRRASVLPTLDSLHQPADERSPSRPRPRSRPRPLSISPFTRPQSDLAGAGPSASDGNGLVRRRSRLARARSSFASSIPSIFRRNSAAPASEPAPLPPSTPEPPSSRTRPAASRAASDEAPLPRLQTPDITLDFDDLAAAVDPPARAGSRRGSQRSTSNLSDRISSLRSDRGIRNLTSSLRRRRSPLRRGEDQAAMLSRLLSVAAAATAATLMGGDHRAVAEARDMAGDGDDGTFASFLQSLQNGRIASALRQGGSEGDPSDGSGGVTTPMNFFRMFRFGNNRPQDPHEQDRLTLNRDDDGSDGRMVPIIIVGIRSISPGNGGADNDPSIPPFLDALSSFPTPLGPPSEAAIDGILRQPHHASRFSHRRRASMGGLSTFPSSYDNQRHSRTLDRPRPRSFMSDTPTGPRPPPSTPASAALSAFSSGTTTPAAAPDPLPDQPSRRGSFGRRGTAATLDAPAAPPPLRPQRTPRQRRLSESDFTRFGAGSARRNGVVEPDSHGGGGGGGGGGGSGSGAGEAPSPEGSRSWIIYVLGGQYPENHPILTTPSLFTDAPTYEDMLLLSALLGPAKPPVASQADVAGALGVFRMGARGEGEAGLAAVAVGGGEEGFVVREEERCLVCLCGYEPGEEARRLVKCQHLFHRECIDQWLTTGRNSCPLCRGQGVDEKTAAAPATAAADDAPATPTASAEVA